MHFINNIAKKLSYNTMIVPNIFMIHFNIKCYRLLHLFNYKSKMQTVFIFVFNVYQYFILRLFFIYFFNVLYIFSSVTCCDKVYLHIKMITIPTDSNYYVLGLGTHVALHVKFFAEPDSPE